jgi:hypothetical protein
MWESINPFSMTNAKEGYKDKADRFGGIGAGCEVEGNCLTDGQLQNMSDAVGILAAASPGPIINSMAAKTSIRLASRSATEIVTPVEKFSQYVFKAGDPSGKGAIFRSLGYSAKDSKHLSQLYSKQASRNIANGRFTRGDVTQYGQRITMNVNVAGRGASAGKNYQVKTGWLIRNNGSVTLSTPFSGFK